MQKRNISNKTIALRIQKIVFIIIPISILLFSFFPKQEEKLIEAMIDKGYPKPAHYIELLDEKKVKNGENLVKTGYALENPKKAPISLHFNCTHCHQLTVKSNIKLPASTLFGVVNRISWYNDDYQLKYGEGIKTARSSLRNAIQYCAQECAQGRTLTSNEIEDILQYLWTLDLKTSDVKKQTLDLISTKKMTYDELKKEALLYSKATFVSPQEAKKEVDKLQGNPQHGRNIYVYGCMSCHKQGGVTNFLLDESSISLRFLEKNLKKDTKYNLYTIVYEGTWAKPGYKPYMPRYTKENMSFQEMADLIAYIKSSNSKYH